MKTWIFTEDTIKVALDNWVADAHATKHPEALKNAMFFKEAFMDLLLTADPKLYKDYEASPKSSQSPLAVSPVVPSPHVDSSKDAVVKHDTNTKNEAVNFSIDDMKNTFYGEYD